MTTGTCARTFLSVLFTVLGLVVVGAFATAFYQRPVTILFTIGICALVAALWWALDHQGDP